MARLPAAGGKPAAPEEIKHAEPAPDPKLAAAAEIADAGTAEAPYEGKPKPEPRKAARGNPKVAVPLTKLDDTEEFVNACFYGTEGSGKTTSAMFLANGGRILVVNAEAGIKARRLKQLGVRTENIVVWPPPGEDVSFKGLEELYWQLKGDLLEDPHAWHGVVWDSLTEIAKKLLDDVVQYQVSKAERAGKDRERFFIDRADYGTMTEQARLLIRRFRDLPCHFALTALERRDQDDDGAVLYGPAVTPALMTDVGGFVDILLHCRVTEGVSADGEPTELYAAYTRKGTKYRAKDRWYATPRLMADPFFDRVLGYVREELDADTDERQIEARAAVARLEKLEEEKAAARAARKKNAA